jgi:hypothetical protein
VNKSTCIIVPPDLLTFPSMWRSLPRVGATTAFDDEPRHLAVFDCLEGVAYETLGV